MKKLIALFVVASLVMSAVGCGSPATTTGATKPGPSGSTVPAGSGAAPTSPPKT